MKTLRNMKRRRSSFRLIVLSLVVGIIGGPAWSNTSGLAATVQVATVATVDSTLDIPVSGTVIESDGAILTVSGYETINSTKVTDADGTSPRVVLSFDFTHVMASDGTPATGVLKTGGYQVIKIRPLQASDVIPITCPYYLNKLGVSTAETWLVTTTLKFDVITGLLAGGSASVGANPYLSFTTFL